MLPTYYAAEYIASGQLRVILPQARPQELGIYGVYVSRRQMPLVPAVHAGFPGGTTGAGALGQAGRRLRARYMAV